MTLPRWDSVAALYWRQKSMMLTPCGPRAVPTGGAGVAAPACSCTLTTAAIFFFLGAISNWSLPAHHRSDLGDLIEGKLDRGLPAEDGNEHLELLGVRIYFAHRGRQGGERAVHHRNGFAGLEFHRGPAHLGLRRLRLRLGGQQRGHLVQAER